MTINKVMQHKKIIISLDGRLDTITAPKLQDELTASFEKSSEITLDFTNLSYISSAGLRTLLAGHKTAVAKNATMTLTGVSEDILEVINMTGFSEFLTIE